MNDLITWVCNWQVEKRAHPGAQPYELLIREGNLLVNTGKAAIWDLLIGGATDPFDNTNAAIEVGDGSTPVVATQTSLQGSSTFRAGMEATYPLFATATTLSFRSEFGATEANFDWNEWGIFNDPTSGGDMLNRKVEALGTKSNPEVWTFTVTLSLQ